jgi:hypothetical protein
MRSLRAAVEFALWRKKARAGDLLSVLLQFNSESIKEPSIKVRPLPKKAVSFVVERVATPIGRVGYWCVKKRAQFAHGAEP